ncbi:hypothetical protein ACFW31_23205 [Nocardiopsis alba]|uniref:hypothetical protein n=1 Tax=Nocardiopsis alba TaxID=53437 RepID=UPI00366F9421
MSDHLGIQNEDSLYIGGRELGEEAAELNGRAKALFNAMESDVREAMAGSAPGELMAAHEGLNKSFETMMLWMDSMKERLQGSNADIVRADQDSASGMGGAAANAAGLPSINY